MSNPNRHPSGVPIGGQFAPQQRSSADLDLIDDDLSEYAVTSDLGTRLWWSSDEDHAREQHILAFPEEPILSVKLRSGVPEVTVNVQWQVWDDQDRAVDTGSASFDLGPMIAETEPEQRITEFGDPDSPGALDHYVELAQERGLIDKHGGPFYAHSSDLDDIVRRGQLEEVTYQAPPKIVPGVPLQEPLSIEEVLAEADEDGFITATVTVDLEDLIVAARTGGDDSDEHDLLAAKVSPLLPYDSSYQATGVAEDGTLLIDFTSNVREASLTQGYGEDEVFL